MARHRSPSMALDRLTLFLAGAGRRARAALRAIARQSRRHLSCARRERPLPWQERLPATALRAARLRTGRGACCRARPHPSTATGCCRNTSPCRSASCSSNSAGLDRAASAAPGRSWRSSCCSTAANRCWPPASAPTILRCSARRRSTCSRSAATVSTCRTRGGAPRRAGPDAAARLRGVQRGVGGRLRRRRRARRSRSCRSTRPTT